MFFNMMKFLIAKPLLIEVQICPSLSVKHRGCPDGRKARPKVTVANNVQGDENTWALFSSEKWKVFGTIALLFVCDKYYPIID